MERVVSCSAMVVRSNSPWTIYLAIHQSIEVASFWVATKHYHRYKRSELLNKTARTKRLVMSFVCYSVQSRIHNRIPGAVETCQYNTPLSIWLSLDKITNRRSPLVSPAQLTHSFEVFSVAFSAAIDLSIRYQVISTFGSQTPVNRSTHAADAVLLCCWPDVRLFTVSVDTDFAAVDIAHSIYIYIYC